MENLLDIQLVTWNGEKWLRACLDSLAQQTFVRWNLRVLDNASSDGTFSLVSDWIQKHSGTITRSKTNTGFAPAHNELIRQGNAKYVCILNQDVELTPQYLEQLIDTMEQHGELSSASGLLLRLEEGERGANKTETIDSAGLRLHRTHRVTERERGLTWQKSSALEYTFGVSATAAVYRRDALEAVSFERHGRREYFDESFETYKEDIDLAYRLALFGWKSVCRRDAITYHARSLRGVDDSDQSLGSVRTIVNRKRRSQRFRSLSYRNHLLFLRSQFFFPLWTAPWWWTVFYETGKFFTQLFLEPRTLMALLDVWGLRLETRLKRMQLKSAGADWRNIIDRMQDKIPALVDRGIGQGEATPELSILIVNYRTKRLLRQCLKGIKRCPPSDSYEVIVVDNGSNDGSVEVVAAEFPEVKIVPLTENVGYAKGTNAGLKVVKGEFVLLLNADVVVLEHSFDDLLNYIKKHAAVGAVGPRSQNPDGTLQESAFGFHKLTTPLFSRTLLGKTTYGRRELERFRLRGWDHTSEARVGWLLSSCLLLRREAIEEVGPWDERFFVYLSDTDYCRRLWLKGWEVRYVPQSLFIHYHRRQSADDWRVAIIHGLDWLRYLWKWRGQEPPEIENF